MNRHEQKLQNLQDFINHHELLDFSALKIKVVTVTNDFIQIHIKSVNNNSLTCFCIDDDTTYYSFLKVIELCIKLNNMEV